MTDWAEQARLGELLVTIEGKYNRGKAMTEHEIEEAVARVLCKSMDGDPDALDVFDGHEQWRDHVLQARAAIETYRKLMASEAVGHVMQKSIEMAKDKLYAPVMMFFGPYVGSFGDEPYLTLFAAPPAPPRGWKLMPIEPTEEILEVLRHGRTDDIVRIEYAELLEAPPTPEAP